MSIVLSGDVDGLVDIATRFKDLPEELLKLNRLLAEETIDIIRDGFEDSRDPYGLPWDKLVLRDGRPLEDTGGLKNSWNYTHSTKGFTVGSGKDYAIYHQSGTGLYGPRKQRIRPKNGKALRLGKSGLVRKSVRGTPPRKMLPDGVLPPRWVARYQRVADEFFASKMRRRSRHG